MNKKLLLILISLFPFYILAETTKIKKPTLIKNTASASGAFKMIASGEKIIKEYKGYKEETDEVTPEIFLQVQYDEKYRASKIELQKYIISGLSQKEYPAFHLVASFAPVVQKGLNNYDEYLKVLFKPSADEDHSLYFIIDNKFKLVRGYTKKELVNGKFNLDSSLRLTKEGGANIVLDKGIFALIPDSEIASIEKISSPENLETYTISVMGEPFDSWVEEQISPSSHAEMTGTPPHIVNYTDGKTLTVAWMEANGKKVHIQEFAADFEPQKEIVYNTTFPIFGGFTKDDKGNYFLVVAKNNRDGDFSPNIKLVKLDSKGKEEKSYSPLIDRKNYDVMKPIDAGTSRVVYGNSKVAVHMGKIQHRNAPDGLNHQSGILFVVNSDTMEFLKDESSTWTASHSFDQRMIFDGTDFVNMDLADAFPRGISITKKKSPKLIFTYKAGKMYQKTFTELGNLIALPESYLVLAASEKDFDPAHADEYLNDSRNLFILKVANNFPEIKPEMKSPYMISQDIVISKGESSPEISFIDYSGKKFPQKRVGVAWLSDYKDKETENILRPKLIQVDEDKFLALYEKWSANSYLTTEYLLFNSNGKILQEPVDIGSARLNRKDDPVRLNGKVIWTCGKKDKGQLKVFILSP